MRRFWILLLLTSFGFADFTDVEDLAAVANDEGVITLTWTTQKLTSETPLNYIVEWEQSRNGTFNSSDGDYEKWRISLYDKDAEDDVLVLYNLGGRAPGPWRIRMRILHKPGDPGDEVTAWSNIAFVEVPVTIDIPVLSLHVQSTTTSADMVSISVGTADENSVDLYYGRDSDVQNKWEVHERNIQKQLFNVDLTQFAPGDRIFFAARAYSSRFPDGDWSESKILVWDPDVKFFTYVPHVTNGPETETYLYITSDNPEPNLLEFSAQLPGGIFGEPRAPTLAHYWVGVNGKFNVRTTDIYPGIHRKPIAIKSDFPITCSVVYVTQFGTSKNVGVIEAPKDFDKALIIQGLWGDSNSRSGVAVSNITSKDGYVAFRLVSVDNQVFDLLQTQSEPGALSIGAYSSSVVMLDNVPDNFVGTLEITGNVDIVALGVVASFHKDFSTLHYVPAEVRR